MIRSPTCASRRHFNGLARVLGRGKLRRVRGDPLGRLPERTIKVELGRVVLIDGRGVLLEGHVECDQGGDDFLRPNDQPKQLARRPRRLA